MRKPRIVQMVEAFEKVGGPPKGVRMIVAGPLRHKYEFHVLSYMIFGLSPGAIFNLRRRLIQINPDLVHIRGLKIDGFHAVAAARLAHVPRVVVSVHGSTVDAICDYQTPSLKVRRWIVGHIFEPATLRLAHAVYCVCDAMKKDRRIQRHAHKKLYETIYNGVKITPLREKNIPLRKSFGFTEDDIVLIYTGRISKDKGLEVLASAMNKVLSDTYALHDRLRLILVGDGQEFDYIRSCFQSLLQSRHVVMTGRREDIDILHAMADIFVIPSFHENLSFSILEAMNAGLPIIATAVGGNVEVVLDGVTGLLVPPSDAAALAKTILRLYANRELRKEMGLAGRERLINLFSASSLTEKTGALYESLLESST